MSRILRIVPLLAALCVCGCAANTYETLIRDRAAGWTDVADYLAKVVDEDSAESFQKTIMPRLKVRLEDTKKRLEMWEKYANDDQKKAKQKMDDALVKIGGAKIEFHDDMFENDETVIVAIEMIKARERCVREQLRIMAIFDKLGANPGEFPMLYRCTTAGKDLSVLGDGR